MATAISINVDVRKAARGLSKLEKKQMPYAISLALNATAFTVKEKETEHLSIVLDRPTPYTKRGIFTVRATKRKPIALIGVKDVQAEYLKYQQSGGVRRPNRRAIVVPVANAVGFRRNRYGNMSRGAIKRVLAKPEVFSGKVKGVAGIWRRPKRGAQRRGGQGAKGKNTLVLLASYKNRAKYRRKMDFYGVAEKTIKREFNHNMRASFNKAMLSR